MHGLLNIDISIVINELIYTLLYFLTILFFISSYVDSSLYKCTQVKLL